MNNDGGVSVKDKPCILVVDDDPNISRLEQLYLEKEGYEVKVAADGNEAIESFRKLPPDCVTDVRLAHAAHHAVNFHRSSDHIDNLFSVLYLQC